MLWRQTHIFQLLIKYEYYCHTIVPRFIRANGDREKLIFINEKEAPISFDDARIEEAIKTTGAKLLILDPLSSYIGDCQLNAANEVRPRFNHLIRIAKETNAAIVIVNHLNKMFGTKAIYRTPGSIDIVGAVRSALLIGRSKENDDERVMVQHIASAVKSTVKIRLYQLSCMPMRSTVLCLRSWASRSIIIIFM